MSRMSIGTVRQQESLIAHMSHESTQITHSPTLSHTQRLTVGPQSCVEVGLIVVRCCCTVEGGWEAARASAWTCQTKDCSLCGTFRQRCCRTCQWPEESKAAGSQLDPGLNCIPLKFHIQQYYLQRNPIWHHWNNQETQTSTSLQNWGLGQLLTLTVSWILSAPWQRGWPSLQCGVCFCFGLTVETDKQRLMGVSWSHSVFIGKWSVNSLGWKDQEIFFCCCWHVSCW